MYVHTYTHTYVCTMHCRYSTMKTSFDAQTYACTVQQSNKNTLLHTPAVPISPFIPWRPMSPLLPSTPGSPFCPGSPFGPTGPYKGEGGGHGDDNKTHGRQLHLALLLSEAVYHVSYAQEPTNTYVYIDVVMNLYSIMTLILQATPPSSSSVLFPFNISHVSKRCGIGSHLSLEWTQ